MVAKRERSSGEPPDESRRRFLKRSGIVVGGALTGGVIGAAVAGDADHASNTAHGFAPLAPRSEPGFDHVVVVMFENRSFDNLLGWLYEEGSTPQGAAFDGLVARELTNVGPDGVAVPAHVYEGPTDFVMRQPDPDPGEFYSHVNTQLFNRIDPPGNADIRANGISAPFNAPDPGERPTMSGFVNDYAVNFRNIHGREPTPAEFRVAMGSFSPQMLPVLSTLAREFAVYDSWFCAVPSETFCNRSFFHASTSHGFVTNGEGGGPGKWLNVDYAPTLFNRLSEAGVSWRVYYDESELVSFTGMLHAVAIEKYWKSNFRGMGQFYEDVRNGTLPAYAFVEPRMIFNHNDMHPPFGRLRDSTVGDRSVFDSALSDVRAGEVLLSDIFLAIKNSASTSGSNAINTALVVTFDEHGGTYDHVPPPSATPPDALATPGEMGFRFDRLGCRVPTLVVSAYTQRETIINDEMNHGSIIKTLSQIHGLAPLTDRDASASGIFNAVNLKVPRQPALWPAPTAAYTPPNPEATNTPHDRDRLHPLTPPAKGLLGLLLAKYDPKAPIPETYGDAYAALVKHGTGLFGIND